MSEKKQIIVLYLITLFSILLILTYTFLFFYNSFNSYTIVILPDTQKELRNFPEVYNTQIDWIVNNKDSLNLLAVAHLGDMVDQPNNLTQHELFSKGINKLEQNNIPYILALGNHDHPSKLHDEFFPVSRISNTAWFGNCYNNDTDNCYIKFNKQKLAIIALDFCPKPDEINFVNNSINELKKFDIILITHGFLGKDGDRKVHVCGDTEYIWNQLVYPNNNVKMVISGHVHSQVIRMDKNKYGNKVYQILSDYQNYPNGGDGWLNLLTFRKNQISFQTYSPYQKTTLNGLAQDFTIIK